MARKRLNKKVAIIGSLIFIFAVFAAIGAFLYLSRDPEKFIKDGDAALLAGNYEEAAISYNKARVRAKSDSLKVELLFKIADAYINIDKWDNVLGCWNRIVQVDPKNIKARLSRLNYLYIMANSIVGVRGAGPWQEIASQVSELMEVAEDAELLNEDTAKWKPFGLQQTGMSDSQLGTYLHLLRGRAILEMAIAGAVTDPDESLDRAIDDLEEVRKLQPANVDTHRCLAEALIEKGNIAASRGDLDQKDEAAEQAKKVLEQAVEVAGDNPKTHINLFQMKLALARDRRSREQIEALESECQSLVDRFNTSAEAFSTLSNYHQLVGLKNIDKALEAAERALELDKENVNYATRAAVVNYTKYSAHGQRSNIRRAVEILNNALTLPGAQDKPGPKRWASRNNRITLYSLLAQYYIEQVLDPQRSGITTESQKEQLISKAKEAVHQIEQLIGSGEDPTVVKWQGMLDLAEGNRTTAIKKLYATYEQYKASGQRDRVLAYWLAQIFRGTTEIGASNEFFLSALGTPPGIQDTKPEALLDYAEVLLNLRSNAGALSAVKFFEDNYGANNRSKVLRIMAYIGGGQFDEAEKELIDAAPDDPNTIKLNWQLVWAKSRELQRAIAQRQIQGIIPQAVPGADEQQRLEAEAADALAQAELAGYYDTLAQLAEKMLPIEPNSVGIGSIMIIFRNYVKAGKFKEAEEIVDKFLEYFPDNVTAMFLKDTLAEPQPDKISPERLYEIEENLLAGVADPVTKAMGFGTFYRSNNEPNKAILEFKKALETDTAAAEGKMTESQQLAAIALYELALQVKDWQLAEQMTDIARRENLDGCQGDFYAARVAIGKEQWEEALTKINESLKQRPVFSYAYMLRSIVNAAVGNEYASVEDARKAWSFNPSDGAITKRLAFVLLERNEKLGDNATPEQVAEAKDALMKALALNPGDLRLISFYAEYIGDDDPKTALALRQSLQKNAPSMFNALLLGKMAVRIAVKEEDPGQKKAYFSIAASAFEQALAMEPQNREVLNAYADYYRLTDQDEKARQLLAQSQDEKLLWAYHIRTGQFELAKELLERLYQADPEDKSVVGGLLIVADGTADEEGVRKYSEELLLLEDNLQNRLFQIQAFLKIGLVKEARQKLQSLREEYPDEPRVLLLEAWLAMRQGQLEKALDLTNRSLETDDNNAMAWRLRGQINFVRADYSQAISDLKRSKLLSDEPATRVALTKAYLRAGRSEDAITELETTIDHPQAPPGARGLLEEIYWYLGRTEPLKRFYAQTLEKFPDSVQWHTRAGAFFLTQEEFDKAEQLYKQALQLSKKDGQLDRAALSGYLEVLLSAGKYNKLFKEASKYIDGDLAPVAYFRMAEAKKKLGDIEAATQYCRSAVDKAGADENVAVDILREMRKLLGPEAVASYCNERLESNPDSLSANYTMFNLMKMSGEYNKALHHLDKCIQLLGPDHPRKRGYLREKAAILTSAYTKTSDNNYLRSAITEYESLLVEAPNNIAVLNNLAYLLAENNQKLPQALEYAERARNLMPNNGDLLDTYAYVLYKNGRYSEAAEYLQAALQQYEQKSISAPATAYEHLGMIKEKLGAKDEALAAYRQALRVGADGLSQTVKERINSVIERLSRAGDSGADSE